MVPTKSNDDFLKRLLWPPSINFDHGSQLMMGSSMMGHRCAADFIC